MSVPTQVTQQVLETELIHIQTPPEPHETNTICSTVDLYFISVQQEGSGSGYKLVKCFPIIKKVPRTYYQRALTQMLGVAMPSLHAVHHH